MNTCTFFGHRDSPTNIENILRSTIEHLIIKNRVSSFYVGDSGNFDRMVLGVLKGLKVKIPSHKIYSCSGVSAPKCR